MGPPARYTEELHGSFEKGEGDVDPEATIRMSVPLSYFPVRHDSLADPDS